MQFIILKHWWYRNQNDQSFSVTSRIVFLLINKEINVFETLFICFDYHWRLPCFPLVHNYEISFIMLSYFQGRNRNYLSESATLVIYQLCSTNDFFLFILLVILILNILFLIIINIIIIICIIITILYFYIMLLKQE